MLSDLEMCHTERLHLELELLSAFHCVHLLQLELKRLASFSEGETVQLDFEAVDKLQLLLIIVFLILL